MVSARADVHVVLSPLCCRPQIWGHHALFAVQPSPTEVDDGLLDTRRRRARRGPTAS